MRSRTVTESLGFSKASEAVDWVGIDPVLDADTLDMIGVVLGWLREGEGSAGRGNRGTSVGDWPIGVQRTPLGPITRVSIL